MPNVRTLNISGLNLSKIDDLQRFKRLEVVIVDKDHNIFTKKKLLKQLDDNKIKLIVE